MYCVLKARFGTGLQLTTLLVMFQENVQVAAGESASADSTESRSMLSENVSVMSVVTLVPVAPAAGEWESTVGGVVSGGFAVVKENAIVPWSALPAMSLPATATEYSVP